ncbi:proline dehydrogenase family protein [Paenibacillus thiaminolyticus]|uniref:proline dehydrogenase n=1 Tax=Paenibacillus thiaminolyticus TaxID=49283 RepID=A0AAP9DQS5_PANTH|nr:proline dehydrogenase family protein [Paenibacillus thiaminolyticus]MCY9534802.1 proline dehydrogenase family protein [Paenibacillus thiaminolyticus]MCY9603927.1 proline dehydrogenase family protein [Paenibacillus thiaminolyticus]MCY9606831.1 proline dehydrogenase family protein [Paenibacillus thiaminolyticus]MCY9615823.1 proline dehydrogenase family protein [Paenibacillus thiaminolyticus]MCY9619057.1 proline dehydrogenase family protein [Paenibacillus thiaminolyticus]
MVTMTNLEEKFAEAMKTIARRADLKTYVEQTPAIYQLLQRAAAKYVTGEKRQDGLEAGRQLADKGYAISLEYIGENTTDVQACEAAVLELSLLIHALAERGIPARVSFDLSHIGLSLDSDLAFKNLTALAALARQAGIELFVSMEESAKTDAILTIYKRAAAAYENIGITLQAQLNRTALDLTSLQPIPGRVRIVKGAYQEPEQLAMPRSSALNEKYVQLVEQAIHLGHRVSIATHDESIVDEIIKRGWIHEPGAEFELLYGIRPDLSSQLKKAGYPVRIYVTYGHEWYLYLCHRIAEYPPNLFQAIVDITGAGKADPMLDYE